jgi:iron complex outermembrane recepter protein
MRILAVLAAITLAAFSSTAIGQQPATRRASISGRVVEAASGAPIVGARVQLVDAHKDDITHDDGAFALMNVPDGTYTLRALRIGYAPISVRVQVSGGTSEPVTVRMPDAAVKLEAVVTTGTVGPKSAAEVLSPTSVMSDAELDRRLQNTIAATLATQPGVTSTSIGPATARPVIRGLTGNRVVMLEDGARSGDLSSTSGDHAVAVDPVTVKQIEVVRGPMSLLYGSSALGGVINAIREEIPTTRNEHASGSLTAEGSSVDAGAAIGGYAAQTLGHFGFRADASARRAGDTHTPLGTLAGSNVETLTGAIAGSVIGAQSYAGASYRYFDNSYGVPGGFVGGHDESVHIDMRRHVARGEAHIHEVGPFEGVKAVATYTDYRHSEKEPSGSVGTRFNQQISNVNLLARHGARGAFSEGAIGANWQYRDIQTGGTVRTPSTYDISAAIFGVEEATKGNVHMQAGLRYDWATYNPYEKGAVVIVNDKAIPARRRTFGAISGSVGALYDFRPGVQFGGSVSRAYRTPDFNELYSNGPHLAAFSFDVGNPDLEQETGLGIDLFTRASNEKARAELAVFRNQMHGFIFPRATGDLGLQGNRPKFQFTGRNALLTGAEGQVEVSVSRRVVLEATLSYVRGTFIGAVDSLPADSAHGIFFSRPGSKYIPFMPPLNGHAGARFETPRWIASTGVRFAASQHNIGDFETKTAGYALVDASAGIRLFDGRRSHGITLRIENALDTEYRNHLARTKEISPEAGRNIALVYRLSF